MVRPADPGRASGRQSHHEHSHNRDRPGKRSGGQRLCPTGRRVPGFSRFQRKASPTASSSPFQRWPGSACCGTPSTGSLHLKTVEAAAHGFGINAQIFEVRRVADIAEVFMRPTARCLSRRTCVITSAASIRGLQSVRRRRLPIMPTLVAAYRDWVRLLLALLTIIVSALAEPPSLHWVAGLSLSVRKRKARDGHAAKLRGAPDFHQ